MIQEAQERELMVCAKCGIERTDYEGPDQYLERCPNCGYATGVIAWSGVTQYMPTSEPAPRVSPPPAQEGQWRVTPHGFSNGVLLLNVGPTDQEFCDLLNARAAEVRELREALRRIATVEIEDDPNPLYAAAGAHGARAASPREGYTMTQDTQERCTTCGFGGNIRFNVCQSCGNSQEPVSPPPAQEGTRRIPLSNEQMNQDTYDPSLGSPPAQEGPWRAEKKGRYYWLVKGDVNRGGLAFRMSSEDAVHGYSGAEQLARILNARDAKVRELREALEQAKRRFVQIQQTDEITGRERLRDIASWGMSEVIDAIGEASHDE